MITKDGKFRLFETKKGLIIYDHPNYTKIADRQPWEFIMYEEIASQIRRATKDGNKVAMLHLQVLLHANELEGVDPLAFCEMVGLPPSYATEFRKMISLAKLMEKQNIELR